MYHVRALTAEGHTIRQLTTNFGSVKEAKEAAAKATRIHGEDHVVCVSVDPKDQDSATKRDPLKVGWAVYDPKQH